jgi:hypothetical protein
MVEIRGEAVYIFSAWQGYTLIHITIDGDRWWQTGSDFWSMCDGASSRSVGLDCAFAWVIYNFK